MKTSKTADVYTLADVWKICSDIIFLSYPLTRLYNKKLKISKLFLLSRGMKHKLIKYWCWWEFISIVCIWIQKKGWVRIVKQWLSISHSYLWGTRKSQSRTAERLETRHPKRDVAMTLVSWTRMLPLRKIRINPAARHYHDAVLAFTTAEDHWNWGVGGGAGREGRWGGVGGGGLSQPNNHH